METVSRKSARARGLAFYFTGNPCLRGHISERYVESKYCRACKPAWELENQAKVKLYQKQNRARHKDARSLITKEWRSQNLATDRSRNNQWKKDHHSEVLAYDREQRRLYPWKNKLKVSVRRAARDRAMPVWVNRQVLLEIYRQCPVGMQVDHIVPLRNKLVSGLHVPWNLQYLPALENLVKSNRFSAS